LALALLRLALPLTLPLALRLSLSLALSGLLALGGLALLTADGLGTFGRLIAGLCGLALGALVLALVGADDLGLIGHEEDEGLALLRVLGLLLLTLLLLALLLLGLLLLTLLLLGLLLPLLLLGLLLPLLLLRLGGVVGDEDDGMVLDADVGEGAFDGKALVLIGGRGGERGRGPAQGEEHYIERLRGKQHTAPPKCGKRENGGRGVDASSPPF
jgi:hypothetical protein